MKKSKASALTLALRRERALKEQLTAALEQRGQKSARVAELEIQLREARRRTIPLADGMYGGADLNFLPLAITNLEIKQEPEEILSWSGERTYVKGPCRATIEVEGTTLQFGDNAKGLYRQEP